MVQSRTFEPFDLDSVPITKFMFFTGKGGVGKTSVACATAVTLADKGFKVLLISTDPASNLQDVFEIELTNTQTRIEGVDNLWVVNLNPIDAAQAYRDSVIEPYIGKLPDNILTNMKEQLSGSCTVEIAAFNEFTKYLVDNDGIDTYDYIIFDTAPTGHTLRMLQLPSAWDHFISESTHGASCLGQLSGLQDNKQKYADAVEILGDRTKTTIVLVAKADSSPLFEAERASKELIDIGISNQVLVINGMITKSSNDAIEESMIHKQHLALSKFPQGLELLRTYEIPLRSYNVTGIESLRYLLYKDTLIETTAVPTINSKEIDTLISDLITTNKKIIFTMGKGGVGKTTMACAIALGLANRGQSVHLTTTDPANHLKGFLKEHHNITMSEIDEQKELLKYQEEVLSVARETMDEADLEYIKEDLRSPCTQEIAVFRAFAEIVDRSSDEIIVIDTAPTGHTLLLLDSTQSYHNEIARSQGEVPESVKRLLPRLRNQNETEVVIVSLAEATPYFEASRLIEDLQRANIFSKWWIVNSSLVNVETCSSILKAKQMSEYHWISTISEKTKGNTIIVPWIAEAINEDSIKALMNERI
ncbi:arsenical pump-driving ATPase [Erysipelothrix larvae]|uniref:Arsenical pump-driving ATPase n=1 Tax=Erysipelothrix larvae TaxID=1514105 RepID=A0A120JTQ1_9FIRM|nr:arsenical pump-driving ATPase [Erysipelothrix larvae]AMC93602.1 arsenical pump-driving ATPase [Erysipelothrix larvae]